MATRAPDSRASVDADSLLELGRNRLSGAYFPDICANNSSAPDVVMNEGSQKGDMEVGTARTGVANRFGEIARFRKEGARDVMITSCR
ncbi:MAG: hypothetical protein ACF8TS_07555 [Maioricimonas sp. JB049]